MTVMFEEPTVDGATLISSTMTEPKVPSVLMSVITHGTVLINLIPLNAAQDGLVTRLLKNASQLTQETVLVASLSARTTAEESQEATHTDATPPAISAINVRMVTLDAAQTDQLNAQTASSQIQPSSSNATRLIKKIHNANHVTTTRIRLTVAQELRNATIALHQPSFSHVMKRQ